MKRLLIVLSLMGCSSVAGIIDSGPVRGSFALVSVNGAAVPAPAPGGGTLTAGEASLGMNTDHTQWFISLDGKSTTGAATHSAYGGSWYTVSGSAVTLEQTGGGSPLTGTLDGSTLTITKGSDIYRFVK